MHKKQLIISRSDIGAGNRGAGLGPDAIRIEAEKAGWALFSDYPVHEMSHLNANDNAHTAYNNARHIDKIYWVLSQIQQRSTRIFQNTDKSIIFSGDHSNAAGLISGFCQAKPQKTTGVIWIDAHADLHTPYTTPSGNVHGMPLAMLLAEDNLPCRNNDPHKAEVFYWEQLKALNQLDNTPLLTHQNLAFIDIRDFEREESTLIESHNFCAFSPQDRKKDNIETVLSNTMKHLEHCDRLYVSFDVDSLDATLAEGTGTPVENGLSFEEAVYLIENLYKNPRVEALEITEINPLLDSNNALARNLVKHLKTVL